MYVIERRIEELESQLIKLNSLRDDIESQKQDAIDMTVDTLRMVISDAVSYTHLTLPTTPYV